MLPVENISQQTTFAEDEGILIVKIRTNVKNISILIHGKEEKWPRANFKSIQAPEDLRVIKIKSGEAYFSKIFIGNSFFWGPCCYFNIEPNYITYVGDFVVERAVEKEGVIAYTISIDREKDTVSEAKRKYPWIFDRYPYRKNIPACN
jgi:hypothetical protein